MKKQTDSKHMPGRSRAKVKKTLSVMSSFELDSGQTPGFRVKAKGHAAAIKTATNHNTICCTRRVKMHARGVVSENQVTLVEVKNFKRSEESGSEKVILMHNVLISLQDSSQGEANSKLVATWPSCMTA